MIFVNNIQNLLLCFLQPFYMTYEKTMNMTDMKTLVLQFPVGFQRRKLAPDLWADKDREHIAKWPVVGRA